MDLQNNNATHVAALDERGVTLEREGKATKFIPWGVDDEARTAAADAKTAAASASTKATNAKKAADQAAADAAAASETAAAAAAKADTAKQTADEAKAAAEAVGDGFVKTEADEVQTAGVGIQSQNAKDGKPAFELVDNRATIGDKPWDATVTDSEGIAFEEEGDSQIGLIAGDYFTTINAGAQDDRFSAVAKLLAYAQNGGESEASLVLGVKGLKQAGGLAYFRGIEFDARKTEMVIYEGTNIVNRVDLRKLGKEPTIKQPPGHDVEVTINGNSVMCRPLYTVAYDSYDVGSNVIEVYTEVVQAKSGDDYYFLVKSTFNGEIYQGSVLNALLSAV